MLEKLSIRNVAVIDSIDIDFRDGMTVLTGETGAGKSIIIDSINMILGERTNKELVRYGKTSAGVQAVFSANDESKKFLLDNFIEIDEEQIIITRQVNNEGKSIAKVNGVMVTLSMLRELTSYLINIHGQHDNQALLSPKKHINFLDAFAHNKSLLQEYVKNRNELLELKKRADNLQCDEQEKLRRIDLLEYQIKEITDAALINNEDEDLKEQRQIYENAEKITQGIDEAYANLYENTDFPSAYDSLSVALKALEGIKDYDKSLESAYEGLSSAMYSIEDISHDISHFGKGIEYDENILNDIEERLDLISKLKRKYGESIEQINEFAKKAQKELDDIITSDEKLEEINAKIQSKTSDLKNIGIDLRETRKKAADVLSADIEKALHELNIDKAHMSIAIEETDDFFENGMDRVEFMISTNPGEPLKPLVSIASGGELSRVMLAIKSILASADNVDTLIFDEIDTGVSGEAALKIAHKLKEIGKLKQVICITHLPQLTAYADNHYLITKNTDGEMASTSLKYLDEEERVMELARIIDGGEITQSAYNHAKELLLNSL